MKVTVELFILMIFVGSLIAGLLTEGIKKFYENIGKTPKPNVIALLIAIVVGGMGTVCCYIVLKIPFNLVNTIGIIAMVIAHWLGSMIGYDKLIQTIKQIQGGNNEVSKTE